MKQIEISAQLRGTGKGAARQLRAAGRLPAVLYGKGVDSVALFIDRKSFEKIYRRDRNALLKVRIENADGADVRNAMVKDLQVDMLRNEPIHVDLHQINLEDKIRVKVPIHVIGDDAVSAKGAILQHQIREVEIECLPLAVPESIPVHVENLEPGDHVVMGDLAMPEGVKALADAHELVISVLAPKAEEEAPAPAAEEGPAEPELVKKGKEEEAEEKE
ncbi:MAG: 50S ribosomal protein L25 [Ignavibacteriales bacterium]